MKSNWYIKYFDDYHDIKPLKPKQKSLELGCFPVKDCGYCMYFGLFWTGKRPKMIELLPILKKQVTLGEFLHFRTGEDIGIKEDELINQISKHLN